MAVEHDRQITARYQYAPFGQRLRKTIWPAQSAQTTWLFYSDEPTETIVIKDLGNRIHMIGGVRKMAVNQIIKTGVKAGHLSLEILEFQNK